MAVYNDVTTLKQIWTTHTEVEISVFEPDHNEPIFHSKRNF